MPGTLGDYNRKRHFDKTAEPGGSVAKGRSRRLRFVVQHHIASRDHYDFRLEWDGVLKSWAVPKGPSYNMRDKRLAVRVEDHPLDYRNFEGTIPKGEYGGGVVMVWDEGFWVPLVDAEEGLATGPLKFILKGSRLKGKWALIHMAAKRPGDDANWLLIKERDEFENTVDINRFVTSVKSGKTMAEIEAGQVPDPVKSRRRASPAAKATPAAKRQSTRTDLTVEGVVISHAEKILYEEAGITKGDLARYYHKVAKRMMPYVENRLLSAVRCPQGVDGSCFYKKHPVGDNPGVIPVAVPGKNGKTETYFAVSGVQGVMSEVQMNTIEFHTWGSRVQTLEKPDIMVFDLDPDEKLELEKIREGVLDLKDILDQLSLVSFLKTSGGKGYHVVIPFLPAANWETFSTFAKNMAKTMEARWPDRYTSNVRKDRRKNRIFIDWIRNGRGATSIAPYSVRARPDAPVSMPIPWRELGTVEPAGITITSAMARLRRKDPWDGFFTIKQRLKV